MTSTWVKKIFGKKAWAIDTIWVENTVIYNVLEQYAWQESLGHCRNMGRTCCNLQCFWCCALNLHDVA